MLWPAEVTHLITLVDYKYPAALDPCPNFLLGLSPLTTSRLTYIFTPVDYKYYIVVDSCLDLLLYSSPCISCSFLVSMHQGYIHVAPGLSPDDKLVRHFINNNLLLAAWQPCPPRPLRTSVSLQSNQGQWHKGRPLTWQLPDTMSLQRVFKKSLTLNL